MKNIFLIMSLHKHPDYASHADSRALNGDNDPQAEALVLEASVPTRAIKPEQRFRV